MEQTMISLEEKTTNLINEAIENVDRYISISEENLELITGATVFIEGA